MNGNDMLCRYCGQFVGTTRTAVNYVSGSGSPSLCPVCNQMITSRWQTIQEVLTLIPAEPDWSQAPVWAEWFVVVSNGAGLWCSREPHYTLYSSDNEYLWPRSGDGWRVDGMCELAGSVVVPFSSVLPIDWRTTKRKRPTGGGE